MKWNKKIKDGLLKYILSHPSLPDFMWKNERHRCIYSRQNKIENINNEKRIKDLLLQYEILHSSSTDFRENTCGFRDEIK